MSDYHQILEEDKVYLNEVGMRSILQEFVADAMGERPADVYEYMAAWAEKKEANRHNAKEEVAEEAGEYPVEESPRDAAHSNAEPSAPDPSLGRHEGSIDIGRPAKEVSGAANNAPEPKLPPKVIEEVANAVEDEGEL